MRAAGSGYRGTTRAVHPRIADMLDGVAEGGEILASMDVIDIAKARFPVSEPRAVELKGVSERMLVASVDPGLTSLV